MAAVDPSNTQLEDQDQEMFDRMDKAREFKKSIHEAMLERFSNIERRKQEAENREQEKNRSETERIKKESVERERREAERLREEEMRRKKEELERDRKREEEATRNRMVTQLRALMGRQLDMNAVNSMDVDELTTYLGIVTEKTERERKQRVQRESEKQLYLARALREAVLPTTEEFFVSKREECISYWTKAFDTMYEQKKQQQERIISVRPVANRVAPFLTTFATTVSSRRLETLKTEVEKRYQAAEKKRLEEEARKRAEEEARRKIEEARRKAEEERRRAEEERRKAEEERRHREQMELERVEAARRESEERERKLREERVLKMHLDSDDEEDVVKKPRRRAPRAPPASTPTPVPVVSPALTSVSTPAPTPAPKKLVDEEDEWKEITVKRKGRKAPK